MFNSIKFLIATSLILSSSVLALPTTPITRRGTLHSCSVVAQRWSMNSFDVAYFSKPLLANGQGDNSANFWNQESDVTPVGMLLADIKVGSNYLNIKNVANPVNRKTDAGKLSFVWGNKTWDSYSKGGPCTVSPIGNRPAAEATIVSCNFQCDI